MEWWGTQQYCILHPSVKLFSCNPTTNLYIHCSSVAISRNSSRPRTIYIYIYIERPGHFGGQCNATMKLSSLFRCWPYFRAPLIECLKMMDCLLCYASWKLSCLSSIYFSMSPFFETFKHPSSLVYHRQSPCQGDPALLNFGHHALRSQVPDIRWSSVILKIPISVQIPSVSRVYTRAAIDALRIRPARTWISSHFGCLPGIRPEKRRRSQCHPQVSRSLFRKACCTEKACEVEISPI